MLSVVRRILAFDRRGLASLVLFAMRRRDGVPPGAVAVSYAGGQTAMQVALLGVATVEVVGVEFLLRGLGAPEGLRVAFLMGGLFSVLFVCTVITGCITRPHVLTDGELRIRYGVFFDLRIPREAISSMRVVRDFDEAGTITVEDGALAVAVASQTNVVVELHETITAVRPLGRREEVRTVRFFADDPSAVVRGSGGGRLSRRRLRGGRIRRSGGR
ncbi:hypothetical protein FHX41_5477 [Actinomadura hallensis]|uniref:Uncharacterized protein n=1 Tax=Actinomadura hallensis TaxID=337895 RepID=A0A543IM96_9ACTN|nr:hypothetical protein [Actinomadura hallensis]TQM71704.1 hypothetical protein FHX41_5477 [Actinomadura hallensis]